tara:strand:- start:2879 stop:3286 length:408 start_codon:yes stop_codon:yes gene_type:complete
MNKLTHIFSTIAIACLLSGAMLTQLTAQEQTTPEGQPDPKDYKMPGMMKLPTFIDCGPYNEILGIVQGQYGEEPFAIFETFIQIPNGQIVTGPSALYVNTETGTWSVVVEIQSSGLCIVNMGKNFGPASKPGISL